MGLTDNMLALQESPSAICADIGRRLRDLRIQRRLRQQDVADRSGIPLSTYRLMERRGFGSLENFVRAARVLAAEDGFRSLFPADEARRSMDEILRSQRKPSRVRNAAP
jgi:transcriptional regulator with XRE-family HTH domain